MKAPLEGAIVVTDGESYQAIGTHTGRHIGRSTSFDEVWRQAAEMQPPDGVSIALGPGRFVLAETMHLGNGMQLSGAGTATKLECHNPNAEAVVLAQGRKNVIVRDLVVTAGGHPAPQNGVVLADCVHSRVRDLAALGFTGRGICLRDHSILCRVDGCTAAANGIANIALLNLAKGSSSLHHFAPTLVSGCMVARGGVGIECDRSLIVNISGCVAFQNGAPAYLITNHSNSTVIAASRSFQTESDGIRVLASDELTVSGNIIGWQTGHGINVEESRWGTISGNCVIDTGSHNPGGPDLQTRFEDLGALPPASDGIRLVDAAGYSVTGNAIFNWGVVPRMGQGVSEDARSHHNTITGNAVNYYDGGPVASQGTDSLTAANSGLGPQPFRTLDEPAGTFIQSFQPELLDDLIRSLA